MYGKQEKTHQYNPFPVYSVGRNHTSRVLIKQERIVGRDTNVGDLSVLGEGLVEDVIRGVPRQVSCEARRDHTSAADGENGAEG
jgi:hypothetical protein